MNLLLFSPAVISSEILVAARSPSGERSANLRMPEDVGESCNLA